MSETPVIIGVGDIKNRSTAIGDAKEPAVLMLEAIRAAIEDASSSSGSDIQSAIDSIDVVKTWTWPYPDLPGLLASKLGVDKSVKWKRYSDHGGDKPGKLLDEAARRIAKGECKVAVLTGGEALASRAYPYVLKTYMKIPNNLSICMRSSKEASATWLDRALSGRRLSLHAHRPRPRK
jgi:acetyl-CoA acetyltransferase